jgi:uncharacterized protein (DUF305 family)
MRGGENMNNQMRYGLIGLLIGGIAVWLFMSSNINSNNLGMMGFNPNTQSMMQSSSGIDSHFIEQMIPHHEDAITMANLALTKAKRPEVKQLAQNIIDSQSKEIDRMKSWYKEWFGKDVPESTQGMMGNNRGKHGGMMGDESDMTKLEQSADFDKAFIEEMIPHHQMAVMMANMLKGGTRRPEMEKLAQDIISAQTKEIDQMRSWLNEWDR